MSLVPMFGGTARDQVWQRGFASRPESGVSTEREARHGVALRVDAYTAVWQHGTGAQQHAARALRCAGEPVARISDEDDRVSDR
jgi:hypothetical protein